MKDNQLQVLTYNIHKGFSPGNRHFKLHQLRDALIKTNADIMFLQEIQGEHQRHQVNHKNWPNGLHSDFLAKDIWPHVAYGKNAEYRTGHHGNAILSKHAIIEWENINVSPFTWASRSLLHGVIKLDRRELHIICIHLGLIGLERRRQFKLLRQRIEQNVPHDMPLIVAGDFNDWTTQAAKGFSHQLNLEEAHQALHQRYARTWPAWFPMLKMDRIFYRGMKPINCERPRNGIWEKLSDHAPLIANFEI